MPCPPSCLLNFWGKERDEIDCGVFFLMPIVTLAIILGKALQIADKIAKPVSEHVPGDWDFGVGKATLLALALTVLSVFWLGCWRAQNTPDGSLRVSRRQCSRKFPLMNISSNVFGYIGKRATGTSAGTYLIAGPGWAGETPAGAKRIDAPTSLVWVIGRTLVDGVADMPNVAAIQQQYQVKIIPPVVDPVPVKERWGIALQPKMVPVQQVETLDWETYFRWAGQMMKDNPPPAADSAFWKQFEAIGLTPAKGFDPAPLSPATQKGLARGYEAGKQIVKMEAQKTGGVEANGWAYNLNAGKWGQDFNLRAAIAFRSLGQNTPEEALYMNTRKDGDKQPLTGAKNYTITFKKGALPPVDGFWSVTMYNSSDFFVENPLNRSAIGNRTEGLKTAPDGSLTIYVQKDAPEADKVGNWLPAPEGNFRLSMRLYVPKAEILAGKWTPPAVTPQP